MATLYSSLYGPVNTASTSGGEIVYNNSYIYKGPTANLKSVPTSYSGKYDLANGTLNATNTQLFLCPLPAGSRILGIQIAPSADIDADSNFTFNLGTVASATAFGSALMSLQAVTGFSLPATIATDLAQAVVIGANESLILARVAGDLDATGTINFRIELALAS